MSQYNQKYHTDNKGTVIPMRRGDTIPQNGQSNLQGQPTIGFPPYQSQLNTQVQQTQGLQLPQFPQQQGAPQIIRMPQSRQPSLGQYVFPQSELQSPRRLMTQPLQAQPLVTQQTFQFSPDKHIAHPVQPQIHIPPVQKEMHVHYVQQKRQVTRMVMQEIEELVPVEKTRIDYVPVQTIVQKIPTPMEFPVYVFQQPPQQIVKHIIHGDDPESDDEYEKQIYNFNPSGSASTIKRNTQTQRRGNNSGGPGDSQYGGGQSYNGGQRNQRMGNNYPRGYGDNQSRGYGDNYSRGYGDNQSRGYGDNQSRGYGNNYSRGYGDNYSRGYGDNYQGNRRNDSPSRNY